MTYQEPGCAYCPDTVRACRQGESANRGPGYCPSKFMQDGIDTATALYGDGEVLDIAQALGPGRGRGLLPMDPGRGGLPVRQEDGL